MDRQIVEDIHRNVTTPMSTTTTFGNKAASASGPSLDTLGSDGVPFIGQEYQNIGGCSQKTPVSSVNSNNAGGCSQKSRQLPVATNSSEFPGCTSSGLPAPLSGSVLPVQSQVPIAPGLYLPPHLLAPEQSAATLPMPISVPRGEVSLGTSGPSSISERVGTKRYCKVNGCKVIVSDGPGDRNQPLAMCPRHLVEHTARLYHDNILSLAGRQSAVLPGNSSKEEANAMGIDNAASQAARLALDVKPEINATSGADTAQLAVHAKHRRCEQTGCTKIAKYGRQGGPPRFCQQHKRIGMYTSRNGRLMISTRDGSAFRSVNRTPVDKDPKPTIDVALGDNATASASHQKAKEASDVEIGFVVAKPTPAPSTAPVRSTSVYRKLCEVPGCTIQPSYGLSGTTRPRFCVGHKQKGMVGLKNRPCLFPGCLTRPHYGLSRGRPVYCASHKKSGMVHLLKESMTLEKERLARNRAISRKVVAARKAREIEEREALAREDEKGIRIIESPSGGTEEKREIKSEIVEVRAGVAVGRKGRTQMQPRTRAEKDSGDAFQLVDTGSAPSVEFSMLKEARERAAAEAKATGRRARAPSRKLLEACGIISHRAGQKHSKATGKAETTQGNDCSEQSQRMTTAGLTFDGRSGRDRCGKPTPAGDEIRDCDEEGTINKTGEDNDARGLLEKKLTHQKPATSTITLRRADNPMTEEAEEAACARNTALQSLKSAAKTCREGVLKRPRADEAEIDVDGSNISALVKYEVETGTEISRHVRGDSGGGGIGRDINQMERVKEGHLAQDGDHSRSGGLECAQIGCPKIATHGVNGEARYCKWHMLFGMHVIHIEK